MSSAASPSDGGWSPERRRQAAWGIVDAIKDAHRGVDVTGGIPPLDILPGFGGKSRMKCGSHRAHFCTGCGDPTPGKDTCDRSTCSHCAPNWARRRATYVCRKLAALRAYVDSFKQGHQKLHHLSISPQKRGETFRFEGDDPDEVRDRLFQAAYDIMDELGLEGFVVYHPLVGEDGDDRGFWKDVLFNWTDWHDALEELKHHPHVHIIAVGDFVPGENVTDIVEEEVGWLIKRITRGGDDSDDNVSLGDNLDLARAVTYTLSHCGIYETESGRWRYAGRWHGENVNDATPQEKYKMEWERIVRTVSTKTLGLKKRDLLCSNDVVEASTQTALGHFDSAMGSMHGGDGGGDDGDVDDFGDGGHVDATGEVTIGSSGPVDDETVMPDSPDTDVDVDIEVEPCEGPLFDIARAPEFLEDDEWVEQADYADELAHEYERWQRSEDFLGATDRDLDLIQQGRSDEARIDWPPPD